MIELSFIGGLCMYESGENYLETIFILQKRNGSVKSIDIARELDFSKPSVSRAVGLLKEDQLISVDESGNIQMTEKGRKKAESIYERHQYLTDFLVQTAGVSLLIAETDACKIEHIISEDTFKGIKKFLKRSSK